MWRPAIAIALGVALAGTGRTERAIHAMAVPQQAVELDRMPDWSARPK